MGKFFMHMGNVLSVLSRKVYDLGKECVLVG